VLSAIIVNWNGRAYLDRCLRALLGQVPAPDEVLLVDNHSDDGSREFVAANFPSVRVLDTGRNGGPCHARNAGAAAARGERLLFLDNDVVLRPGAIAALLAAADADPMIAMVQARSVCGDDESVVHYDGGDLHYLGTLVLHHWYRPLAQVERGSREVGAAIALCFLTDRARYQEVGGFDENLFILYEDNQFAYKLRMRGHRIWLAADAVCVHLAGTAGLSVRGEGAKYPGRRTYLHSRNRYYVLLTCMRWRTLLLTLPAQLLYGVVYALFGHSKGHVGDWWRGKRELLALLPKAVAARKTIQRGRTVPDRKLLVSEAMTLNPGLADGGGKGALRRVLDGCFAGYWAAVRWLCG
jgi:hypothetical protein